MYILRADTGQAIEVNVSPGASVQSLRELIASIAPIAPQEQILLSTGGKRLDPNKTLEFYGLPAKEKEVFLFNWRAISDPNFPIEDSAPLSIETQVPPLRPLSKEFESKPLIHALKSYEHQFHGHYVMAQAICEAFERRLYTCKMCFSEIHVQVRGIDCAVLNLRNHIGQLVHSQEEFLAHAKLQIKEGEELLEQWDNDLAMLKDVHIHPSLAAPGTTLLDLIPEARLRAWARDSLVETEQVKIRIPPMENQLRQFQQEVEEEIQKPNDVDLRELSDRIFHSEEILKDVITKVQMFAKDFENVRTRVEIALRNTSGQSLGNFCEGFDEIAKVHEAHLSYLRAQDEASKENFLVFARCKAKVSRGVYMRIRSVSAFQARIREGFNLLTVMGEAKSRLVATFSQLSVVKNMPQAYQAAIQEVARRRGFSKKVRRELVRMNETVGKVRDEELPKRERFMNKYFHFVPKDLVPGLQEALPVLEVSVPPFDTNLPQIDSVSTSGEEDDFTIVPFGDEPTPRMQSFDKENAFSQSGSNNYNAYHPNPTNPTPSPYYSNPPTNPPTSTNPIPSSNPIPITSTKGPANPMHTSGGPLSVSPGSDVLKLQKDLAAANQMASNYADRIKHLEGEINKLYREKVERTQQKLEGAHIGGPQFDADMRNLLSTKEETIRSLKAELDTMREKEKSDPQSDPEAEALRTKVFEQERQIERLMIALHTTPEPLVVSGRSAPEQKTPEAGEVERLLGEIEEWKKKEVGWEEERKEAAVKYEGMMRQLTGELDHLREEKLHTSRSWINEKMELEKTQKTMESLKETFAEEKRELETVIKDLQQTVKQQAEAWGKEKLDLEKRVAEIQAAAAVDSEKWAKERGTMLEEFNKEKQGLSGEHERKEAELRKDLGGTQNAVEQLRKELDTLQTEAKKLREDLASAAQTMKENDEAAEKKVEKAKNELRDAVANMESVMVQKDKTALGVSQDLAALRKTHEEAEARANALQTERDDIQSRCTELEKSLEGLKEQKQELSARLESAHQTHEQQLENINNALRAKEASLSDAAAKLKATSDKLKEKEEATNKGEVEVRSIGKELQDAQAALGAKERELQAAQNSLREKEEAFAHTLREKDAALRAVEEALREKSEALVASEDVLRQKVAALHACEEALRERDAAIAQGEEALREKGAALRAVEEALREKSEALVASEDVLRQKVAALLACEEALREKDAAIAQGEEMSRSVANLSELLETKEKGFSEGVLDYERKLMEMEERQKQEEMDRYRMFELEREELVNAHNLKIQQLQLQITELQNELKKQDSGNQILALKNEAIELRTTVTGLQTQLKDMGIAHTQEMDGLAQKYAKKEADINEISVQIQKKNSALEKRLQDSEEEKRRMQQQLEQLSSSQNKVDQLRKVVVELSDNLKNHPACRNLQDQDADEITQFQTRVSAVIAFAHELEEQRDHAARHHVTEASQLRTLLQTKEDRVADLERRLQDAQGQLVAWEMSQNENVPSKISFSKFKAGDLVLFVPKNKAHEAFNINCPNYYLSEDCATLYENQTYVCGQIIEINSRKATARDNPFKLPEGTEFHEVTITSI